MKGLALAKRHLPVNATDCRNPWLKVTEEYVVLFPQAASQFSPNRPDFIISIFNSLTVIICFYIKSRNKRNDSKNNLYIIPTCSGFASILSCKTQETATVISNSFPRKFQQSDYNFQSILSISYSLHV